MTPPLHQQRRAAAKGRARAHYLTWQLLAGGARDQDRGPKLLQTVCTGRERRFVIVGEGLSRAGGWAGGALLRPAVFFEGPVAVAQRAHLPRLQPARDAVEVKCVVCEEAMGRRGWKMSSRRRSQGGTDASEDALQEPHATEDSSVLAEAWFAWHSMPRIGK